MSYRLTETQREYISVIKDLSLSIKVALDNNNNPRDLVLKYSDKDKTEENPNLSVTLPRYSMSYIKENNNLLIKGSGTDTEGIYYEFATPAQRPGWIYTFTNKSPIKEGYLSGVDVAIENDPDSGVVATIPLEKFDKVDVLTQLKMYGYEVQNPDEIINDPACLDGEYTLKLTKNGTTKPAKLVWKEEYRLMNVIFISDLPENSFENKQLVEKNTTVSRPIPDPVAEAYDFTGWTVNGVDYDFSKPVRENLEILAMWAEKIYTVNYITGAWASLPAGFSPDEITYYENIKQPIGYGDDVFTNPSGKQFDFTGWYYENTFDTLVNFSDNSKSRFSNNRALSIYAEWIVKMFDVIFHADGADQTYPIQKIESNELVIHVEDPTKTDYTFNGWYTEDTFENLFDFLTMKVNSDLDLYAKFELSFVETFMYYGEYWTPGSYIVSNTAAQDTFDIDQLRGLLNGSIEPSNIEPNPPGLVGDNGYLNMQVISFNDTLTTVPLSGSGYLFITTPKEISDITAGGLSAFGAFDSAEVIINDIIHYIYYLKEPQSNNSYDFTVVYK